jgi:hypothetical protein
MKSILFILPLVFASYLFAHETANKTPLACQEAAKAGLKWEGNQWNTARFHEDKFILVLEDGSLTIESVAPVIGRPESRVTCKADTQAISEDLTIQCTDDLGGYLFFNPITMKGGEAQLFGSTMSGNKRDTLSVSAFTCTKF